MLGYSREETSTHQCRNTKASVFLVGLTEESCGQDKTGSHELARSRSRAGEPEVGHSRFAASEGSLARNHSMSVLRTPNPEQALIQMGCGPVPNPHTLCIMMNRLVGFYGNSSQMVITCSSATA
jgi:uncharacterized low-complexity protein